MSAQDSEPTDSEVPQISTILSDPQSYSHTHPLQNTWSIWFDHPGKKTNADNWAANLKKISTFSTVEEFWGTFNALTPAGQIQQGSNYHLFKSHIQPMWEDKSNAKGGKWVIQIPRNLRDKIVDQSWLSSVLSCIGEMFEESDEICGVVISVRRANDRISLWTKTADNEAATLSIGKKFKEILQWPENQYAGYQKHDAQQSRGSKDLYTV
ncbi:translation initiation factor eIF4E [Nowakowskiella sp. JEL0407]|nr:translation initiation factor eIF4E [Nowakowskiella sp. JEL0407]